MSKVLIPEHFCLRHAKKSREGRVSWTVGKVNDFALTYCNIPRILVNRVWMRIVMYDLYRKAHVQFSHEGLPMWEYTEKANVDLTSYL